MSLAISPAISPKINWQFQSLDNQAAVVSPVHSLTVPKDLYRRRIWCAAGRSAAGAGYTFVGRLVFYNAGRAEVTIPLITSSVAPPPQTLLLLANSGGLGGPIAGDPGEVLYQASTVLGNAITATPIYMDIQCEKIALEVDSIVLAGGATHQSFLAVMSGMPL